MNLPERRLEVRRGVWQGRERGGRRIEKSTKGRRARRVAITVTFAGRLADLYADSVVGRGVDAGGRSAPAAAARSLSRWRRAAAGRWWVHFQPAQVGAFSTGVDTGRRGILVV